MSSAPPSIDVVVPVYNEEEGLATFHERVRAVPLSLHLIFIDNASTDRTLEILRTFPGVTIIEHEVNEGYGGSIRDGLARATADAVVIIDADCEYPPEAIPALVEGLRDHDVVYASRFLDPSRLTMSSMRRFGNRTITTLFNLLFGQRLTDLYTGCKAIRRQALEGISLERKGFEHVLELAVRLSKSGARFGEVAIDYAPRQTGTAKMKHVSETLKYCYLLLRYRLWT
jgi:glycosyltransferase involved in cell wall biosynthesis